MTKVMVVGSYRHITDQDERAAFEDAAQRIGQQLAANKATVVLCSMSPNTLDHFVLQGMERIDGPHEVKLFVPESEYRDGPPPMPEIFRNASNLKFDRMISPGGWRPAHLRAIRYSDLVLSIGGAERGTGSVVYSAEALEKAVLLVRTFKGASNQAWDDFGRYYNDAERNVLSQPMPLPQEWPASIAKLCNDFANRNPMRRSRPLLAVMSGLVALLLAAGWLWLIVNQPWSPILYMAAVTGVSASVGVILQHSISRDPPDVRAIGWGVAQAVGIALALLIFATALVGDEFLDLIAASDRASITLRFSGVALAAGWLRPEFLKWFSKKARSFFE